MRPYLLILLAGFGGLATAEARPADRAPRANLARAEAVLRSADKSGDGHVDAVEARRAGIPARDFAAEDLDRDTRLSRTEFLTYYCHLAKRSGHKIARDLQSEVLRLQALRRIKARRKKTPSKKQGRGAKRHGP